MPKELRRSSVAKVAHLLWARAAGRCEFNGCNRPLFKSPITEEQGNISEIAHIWSFSEKGARGWGPFASKKNQLNEIPNLMLVCHDCHKIIDEDKEGSRYSANLLCQWKEEHERRIAIVSGVHPSKKSHVVLYGANIGDERSMLQPEHSKEALFPFMYPAEERPITLSMSWEGKDDQLQYWATEARNLEDSFNRQIWPLIEEANPCHFSIFALAPMPLMVLLGSSFTDKVQADVFQLHREPNPTWHWLEGPCDFEFQVRCPNNFNNQPVLIISLSDSIAHDRIQDVLGEDVSIWELTIESPNNDFLKSRNQLSRYRETVRKLMADISKAHSNAMSLSIFPAMPVACAVELGRVRMPKADIPWILYDQNQKHRKFIRALKIGGQHE